MVPCHGNEVRMVDRQLFCVKPRQAINSQKKIMRAGGAGCSSQTGTWLMERDVPTAGPMSGTLEPHGFQALLAVLWVRPGMR